MAAAGDDRLVWLEGRITVEQLVSGLEQAIAKIKEVEAETGKEHRLRVDTEDLLRLSREAIEKLGSVEVSLGDVSRASGETERELLSLFRQAALDVPKVSGALRELEQELGKVRQRGAETRQLSDIVADLRQQFELATIQARNADQSMQKMGEARQTFQGIRDRVKALEDAIRDVAQENPKLVSSYRALATQVVSEIGKADGAIAKMVQGTKEAARQLEGLGFDPGFAAALNREEQQMLATMSRLNNRFVNAMDELEQAARRVDFDPTSAEARKLQMEVIKAADAMTQFARNLPPATEGSTRLEAALRQTAGSAEQATREFRDLIRATDEKAAADRRAATSAKVHEQAKKSLIAQSVVMKRVYRRLIQLVQLYIASFVIRKVRDFTSAIIENRIALQGADEMLTAATESVEEFGRQKEFVTGLTRKFGLEMATVSQQYAKFAQAARSGGMEWAEIQDVFEKVSGALVVLQADTQRTNLTFLALEQMMSKNKLMATELNRQLGNQIPGAVQAMARGLGMTTEELQRLMQQGLIPGTDAVRAFAKSMHEDFGHVVPQSVQNLRATLGRLEVAFVQLTATAGEKLEPAIKSLTDAMSTLGAGLVDTSDAWGPLVELVTRQARDYAALLELQWSLINVNSEWRKDLGFSGKAIMFVVAAMNGLIEAHGELIDKIRFWAKVAREGPKALLEVMPHVTEELEKIQFVGDKLAETFGEVAKKSEDTAKGIREVAHRAEKAETPIDRLHEAFKAIERVQEGVRREQQKTIAEMKHGEEAAEKLEKQIESLTESFGVSEEALNLQAEALLTVAVANQDFFLSHEESAKRMGAALDGLIKNMEALGVEVSPLLIQVRDELHKVETAFDRMGVKTGPVIQGAVDDLVAFEAAIRDGGAATREQAKLIVDSIEGIRASIALLPEDQRAQHEETLRMLSEMEAKYEDLAGKVKALDPAIRSAIDALKAKSEAWKEGSGVVSLEADHIVESIEGMIRAIQELPEEQREANQEIEEALGELLGVYQGARSELEKEIAKIKGALSPEADDKATDSLVRQRKALEDTVKRLKDKEHQTPLTADEIRELEEAEWALWEVTEDLEDAFAVATQEMSNLEAEAADLARQMTGVERSMGRTKREVEGATDLFIAHGGELHKVEKRAKDASIVYDDMADHVTDAGQAVAETTEELTGNEAAIQGLKDAQQDWLDQLDLVPEKSKTVEEALEDEKEMVVSLTTAYGELAEAREEASKAVEALTTKEVSLHEAMEETIRLCEELKRCLAA